MELSALRSRQEGGVWVLDEVASAVLQDLDTVMSGDIPDDLGWISRLHEELAASTKEPK